MLMQGKKTHVLHYILGGEWMIGSLANDITSFVHSIKSVLLLKRLTAGAANYTK